ncbi:MAG: hypothetical protein PHP45_11085 [Elusimicrobiales bacterium]|nr:hypothetical protein [Elusimicrobiales bacterium]
MNLGEIPATKYKKYLLAAAALALYAAAFNVVYTGIYTDDARHILAAQSLLHGRYVNVFLPHPTPIHNLLPGYPLAVAPFLLLGGITGVKLLSLAAAASTVLLLPALLPACFAAALIYALHPMTVNLSGTAMTEPLFILWTVAAFLLLRRNRWQMTPWLLAFCVFASWIRPEGFLFLLAIAPFCAKKMDAKTRLGYAAAALLLFALPYARNTLVSGTPAGYFGELAVGQTTADTLLKLGAGFKSNLLFYLQLTPGTVFVNPFEKPPAALAWLVMLFFWTALARGISAAMRSGEEGRAARAVYVFLMLGMHLFWVNRDPRYIYPLLPFIPEFFFDGLRPFERLKKYALLAASALVIYGGAKAAALALLAPAKAPSDLFEWIKRSVRPDEYVATLSIESLYLHTGRKGYPVSKQENPDVWYAGAVSNKVSYVILEGDRKPIQRVPEKSAAYDLALSRQEKFLSDKTRFQPVFINPAEKVGVFRVTPPKGFERAFSAMQYAVQLSAAGHGAEALKILHTLEKEKAPLKRLDFALGTALLLAGDCRAALPYLERAAAAEPAFAAAARNLELAKKAAGSTRIVQ